MKTVVERVRELIAESLGISAEELSIDTKADDIELWDSMGTMTILLGLESVFGVKLAPGQTEKLQSVRGIVELVESSGKSV